MTAGGALEAVSYSPYDYGVHEHPYPTYARLRDEAPLYHNDELGFWALSRHADVVEAFRDHLTFSPSHGVTLDPAASGPNAHRTMSFLAMDPPMHGRMRGLVSKGFTPRRVAGLEPRIRELARGYLDAAVEAGSCDLIGDVAGRLPMDVISELMGVPTPDRDEVRRLADLLVLGFGRHFCLGASLARLEARVALEELVTRVRSYELHPDGIARVHSINVRGFAALPATLVPR
jgi:cytochrome P450